MGHTGDLRMIDFGIAVQLKNGQPRTGLATGTRSWRSPEAVKSDKRPDGTRPGTLVGLPTDIWGIGSMLRWMCTGQNKKLNELSWAERRAQISMFRSGLSKNLCIVKDAKPSHLKNLNNLCRRLLGTPQSRANFFLKIWDHAFFKQFGGSKFRTRLLKGDITHDKAVMKVIRQNTTYMLIGASPGVKHILELLHAE